MKDKYYCARIDKTVDPDECKKLTELKDVDLYKHEMKITNAKISMGIYAKINEFTTIKLNGEKQALWAFCQGELTLEIDKKKLYSLWDKLEKLFEEEGYELK